MLGLAIMVGFMVFVAMDKGLRIATGGAGHEHSHGHSHAHEHGEVGRVTGSDAANGQAKLRKKKQDGDKEVVVAAAATEEKKKEVNASVKLGGYLNLM